MHDQLMEALADFRAVENELLTIAAILHDRDTGWSRQRMADRVHDAAHHIGLVRSRLTTAAWEDRQLSFT